MDAEVGSPSALQRQVQWLQDYRPRLRVSEQGRVLSVGDGIAWIDGLPTAAMDELLELEDGSRALVFHLKSERLGAILLYQTEHLTAGTPVALTGRRLELPVGDALLGRVVDPLAPARCDGAADRGSHLRRPAAVYGLQDRRHDDPDRKRPAPAPDRR